MKSLDQLGPVADEMLGGLHADESMRMNIVRAAAGQRAAKKNAVRRFAPALCCAALAIVCVGALSARIEPETPDAALTADQPAAGQTVAIASIAAGDVAAYDGAALVADLGDNATLRMASPKAKTLFASGEGDIPLVTVNGAIYQMLETPKDIGNSMLGHSIGDVALFDEQPSLASPKELAAGLSNVAGQGTVIYSVKGLADTTAVAAEVDGGMRLFQRVSYAGRGPSGASLEETFSVRGKVKSCELSGVGTLEGEAANRVMAVLLDEAVLKSADATARKQTLTVTLDNGLKLQLGVSGDTLCGCGGWSCPEFFEAFEAVL